MANTTKQSQDELIQKLQEEMETLASQNKQLKTKLKDFQKLKIREQTERNVHEKMVEEEHKREVQQCQDQFFELKERLPKINRLNLQKSQKITFWEQTPVRYIQYPDNETLEQKTNQEIQPIRLGIFGGYQQYSILAQFGNMPEFRAGYNQDHPQLRIQLELD